MSNSKFVNPTKVITGICTFSYLNCWEPKAIEGGKPKFSVSLVIPKSDTKTVEAAGYDPWERKLMGITAMTSLLEKKKFEELLDSLTYKPRGKPTLAPRTDKRPEMKNTAEEDFKE